MPANPIIRALVLSEAEAWPAPTFAELSQTALKIPAD